MVELSDSLEGMGFMQLLLLFGFVTCYMLAIGGMFGSTVRVRAAGLAVVQAGGFTALTEPWVHGALLVAFVVAGLGLFVVLCWLLARLLSPRRVAPPTRDAQTDGAALPAQLPSLDAREVAPKLARRARAAR